jgi:transposase
MSGRSWIVATAEQRVELRVVADSADRARAILLSLEGWTSDRIALAFCVQPDSVRHWRWIFGREGVAGLRARMAPGPEPVKARAALSVIEAVLAPGVSERPNWTLPRLADEIEKRTGGMDHTPFWYFAIKSYRIRSNCGLTLYFDHVDPVVGRQFGLPQATPPSTPTCWSRRRRSGIVLYHSEYTASIANEHQRNCS